MSNVTLNNEKFEKIKYYNKNNYEYWEARELSKALDYDDWRNFTKVLNKAMKECKDNNRLVEKNFIKYTKKLKFNLKIIDYKLSKYACYLICKNGFSKKEAVLQGREYFKRKEKSS